MSKLIKGRLLKSLFSVFILNLFLIYTYLFLIPTTVFAVIDPADVTQTTITKGYYTSVPANLESAENCPIACNVTGECANSENQNNCNLPRCEGGTAWTKYNLRSCKILSFNEATGRLRCEAVYSKADVVYSIGDKCTSGGPYLNPGYCNSAFGGPVYKTCCSNTNNALSPFQCVPFDADHAGDMEGRCPAGYAREVRCGDNGVTCGQPACGPAGPASPTF